MPIQFRTSKQLVDLFQQAANDHASIEWFNAGDLEYTFSDNHDLTFPEVYLRIMSEQLSDGVKTTQFRLYSFDLPPASIQVDHTAFEYDPAMFNSRDTAFQNMKDIITTVKNANLQNFGLTFDGTFAVSTPSNDGEAGVAGNFSITQTCIF